MHLPGDISTDVTRPSRVICFGVVSDRISQNLTVLSKWPLIILLLALPHTTKSLHLEPANRVLLPAEKKNDSQL